MTGDHLSPRPLISPKTWAWMIGIGAVFVAIHWAFIWSTIRIFMVQQGTVRADWSHVAVIPLISIYYIYQKRQTLKQIPASICWWGLPIMFAGLFSYVWWTYPGRNNMMCGYSMVVSLFGMVLLLLGPAMMRVLWFPIVYLFFAVKVADGLWERIANILQDIAARGSTVVLQVLAPVLDFDVSREGNTIRMLGGNLTDWYPMNVAEACSGLRMLMAFIALGVAMAFLFDRAMWQRIIMVSMAIPIALAINIGRVTTIGIIALYDTELAKGDFHTFVGMLMLIPAALLFLGLGWVLDRIFIEPEPSEQANTPATAGADDDYHPPRHTPAVIQTEGLTRGAVIGLVLVLIAGLAYWVLIGFDWVNAAFMSFNQALGLDMAGSAFVGAALRVLLIAGLILALIPLIRGLTANYRRGAAMGLVAAMLGAWLVTQFAVLHVQGAVLVKKALPLRHELFMMPEVAGPWRVIHRDPPMSKEIEDVLGTTKHLSWYLLDTRMANPKEVDLMRRGFPEGSVVRMHLAYYTGGIDTVPHVPDRCNVAGGFQALGNPFDVTLDIDNGEYTFNPELEVYETTSALEPVVRTDTLKFTARAFTYAPPNNPDRAETVIYFFRANGEYYASPNQVRMLGFDLRDEYSFYIKVQAEALGVSEPKLAVDRTSDMLQFVMPQILAALPDWTEVQAGRYPVDPAALPQPNTK